MMVLELDWPPSVNVIYRWGRGTFRKSEDAKNYAAHVFARRSELYRRHRCWEGPVSVTVWANPPDRRRRDLDNILKVLFDSLESAKIFEDDSQVKKLEMEMGPVIKGGRLIVTIAPRTETSGDESP